MTSMLPIFKEIVMRIVAGYQLVTLEEFDCFGEEKISFTLSSEHLMGSIETLRDFTTDFLIVEFENENILYSMTLENIRSAEEWSSVIVSYLDRLSGYEEKYS